MTANSSDEIEKKLGLCPAKIPIVFAPGGIWVEQEPTGAPATADCPKECTGPVDLSLPEGKIRKIAAQLGRAFLGRPFEICPEVDPVGAEAAKNGTRVSLEPQRPPKF